ncbi:TPA: 2OG-Fe(II) oxygenase [Enterobacter cloacae]
MNTVTEHPNFIVIDDFLLPHLHNEIWKYCQADDYRVVNRERWSKVWRLGDGNPLYGSLVFSNSKVEEHLVRTKGYKQDEYRVCPNGDIVDEFLMQLDSVIPLVASVIGERGEAWLGSTFKPYIYPKGTGLSWHQDGAYSGAFIYYANPEWKADWGGELFLASDSTSEDIRSHHTFTNGRTVALGGHLDSRQEDKVLLSKGTGTYVMPKPNRLVVLGGGIAHKINHVADAAGQPRVSCSGFFIKKPADS